MFATVRRPDAAIEASLEAMLPPPPERDPNEPQNSFLLGNESFLPYQSESEDYLSSGDFYIVKGNTVHPRRRKKDK
jgi:hypothetical protein